jgi:hypothetical protein
MKKTSEVSYMLYLMDKLKKVSFHGKLTYPLYIQITFKGVPHKFKSYYFELLSKPKYAVQMGTATPLTTIVQIIKKEEEVIKFIIKKLGDNFTTELFRNEYSLLTTDLCDLTEKVFNYYLCTFFADQGLPFLSRSLEKASQSQTVVLYEVVADMKNSFKPEIYHRLIENSLYHVLPYLQLYSFAKKGLKNWPVLLPVMLWEKENTKKAFSEHLKIHFPNLDSLAIVNQIETYVQTTVIPLP